MQNPPPEKDANEQGVSLQSILNAIQSHSEQTSAAIKQIHEGMDRLSEKVDYVHQEQIEMESSQDVIRRDMEKQTAEVIKKKKEVDSYIKENKLLNICWKCKRAEADGLKSVQKANGRVTYANSAVVDN